MSTPPLDHGWLKAAESFMSSGDSLEAISAALTGMLSALVEHAASEDREETLSRLHDEADAALGRVLTLADNLEAHPHATLKPTAFVDLADRIRAAVDGEAPR